MRLCKTFPRVFPPTVSSQNFVLNLDLELILEPYSSPCSTSSSLLTRPVSLILIYMKIFDTSTFMEEYFTCNVWAWPRCLWSQHPSGWKNNISPRCFFWMSDPRTLAAATFHLWAHLSKTTEIFLFTESKIFFQPQHLGDSVCEVDMPRHLLTIVVDQPDIEERVDTWLIVCLAQWWQCLTSILLCPRHCRTLTTQVITDNHNFQLNTTLSCHNAEEQTLTIAGADLWPDIIYFLAIIKLFSNVVKKLQHVSLFYHFLAVLNKSQIAIVKTLDYLKYNAIESELKQIW